MNNIKQLISSLHLRLSDLFLVLGFIPMTIFLLYGQVFMQYPDPGDVSLKLEMIIPLFLFLIVSWGLYLFLEFKNGTKVSTAIIYVFVFLALMGIIGISIQPQLFEIDTINKDESLVHVSMTISATHYIFFSFDLISIFLLIFIGLFVLPKRFSSIKPIQFAGYFVFLLCFVLIICSVIIEHDNYIPFIKSVFERDIEAMSLYASKSIIIHKNAYGMTLLLGTIFCLINHSIEKRWAYFPLYIFFYINMIFTYCRTSLLISPILFLIYIYYFLIKDFGTSKKARVSFIILSSLILCFVSLFLVVIITKGAILKPLYLLIDALKNGESIDSREWIWNNTYYLINQNLPLSLIFGRGFGLMNEMLLPINIANWFGGLSFPTHNGYLNLFAEGGFICLFAYLALLGYATYIAIKSFKKNSSTTLAIMLGLLSFVFYSLIETIHYLTYVFMFVLFALYNIVSKQCESNS